MTIKQAIEQIRSLGLTARYTDGEFRVNYRGCDERTAYYTGDRQDAVATAKAMMRFHPVRRSQ